MQAAVVEQEKKVFGLGCTIKKNNGNFLVYSLKIDVANEDRVYVDEENLYELTAEGGRHLLFKTIKKEKYKGDIVVEYDNKKGGRIQEYNVIEAIQFFLS
ncbi:hypothetical protein P9166_14145 [Lactococcus lactis]|nr:hypothetical protein P9166_14145 [Lactococcus lactis]